MQESVDLEKTLISVGGFDIPPTSKSTASDTLSAPLPNQSLYPISTLWTVSQNQPIPERIQSSQHHFPALRFPLPRKPSVEELNLNPNLTAINENYEIQSLKFHTSPLPTTVSAPSRRTQISHLLSRNSASRKVSRKSSPVILRRSLSDLKADVKLAPVQGPIKHISVRPRSDSSPPASSFTRSCSPPTIDSAILERKVTGKENGSPLKKRIPFY
jgi:hypothetical protein